MHHEPFCSPEESTPHDFTMEYRVFNWRDEHIKFGVIKIPYSGIDSFIASILNSKPCARLYLSLQEDQQRETAALWSLKQIKQIQILLKQNKE